MVICMGVMSSSLMDGGNGLNKLYVNTLDKMGIPGSSMRPSKALF